MLLRSQKKQFEKAFLEIPLAGWIASRSVVLAYFVAIVLVAVFSDESPGITIVRLGAVALMLVVSCWPLLFPIAGVGVLHPLYFLSAYNFIKGTLLNFSNYAFGITSHPALPTVRPADIAVIQIEAILLDALGWLMIFAGFRIAKGMSWSWLRFYRKPQLEVYGAILTYCLGMLGFFFLVQLSGGFEPHLKNIARGINAKVFVSDPRFASLYGNLVILTLIAPALMILTGKNMTRRPFFWLLAITASIALFLVNGRRSALLRPVMLFVTCWIHRSGKLPVAAITVLALMLLLSIGVVGEYRRSNWSDAGKKANFDAVQDLSINDLFRLSFQELQERRAGSPLIPIIHRVPSDIAFLYGTNYLGYVKGFIPRALWPGKPRGIGVDCGRVFYGVNWAIPPGVMGEAYWSGGPIGVAIVFFAWGVVLKNLCYFFLRFYASPMAVLLYFMTLATFTPDEGGVRAWIYLVVPTVSVLFTAGMMNFKSVRS